MCGDYFKSTDEIFFMNFSIVITIGLHGIAHLIMVTQ